MLVSSLANRALQRGFCVAGEVGFLQMVSQYFDNAGKVAGIPPDRLQFLKKPDYSLKFNIPFKTGSPTRM